MRASPRSRLGVATSVVIALVLALVVVVGGVSLFMVSQGQTGSSGSGSPTTSTGSTSSASSSSSVSSVSTGSGSTTRASTSSASVSPSSSSSSLSTATQTTTTSAASSSSSPPSNDVVVVIPQGIQDPNASQLKITFQPVHITVVLGVNNTVVFENHDNVEHIIQSTAWPSDSSPFQFWSLPGKTNAVTLNATGDYNYTCVWHPLWMQGSITVVAGK